VSRSYTWATDPAYHQRATLSRYQALQASGDGLLDGLLAAGQPGVSGVLRQPKPGPVTNQPQARRELAGLRGASDHTRSTPGSVSDPETASGTWLPTGRSDSLVEECVLLRENCNRVWGGNGGVPPDRKGNRGAPTRELPRRQHRASSGAS